MWADAVAQHEGGDERKRHGLSDRLCKRRGGLSGGGFRKGPNLKGLQSCPLIAHWHCKFYLSHT